ncbi:lamin tail-like protein [Krasilnikovia cinnamomea]|uniref:Lamin tail-like protein n=1 Tax=Krasilnikovia cinnamomea TaxID=349313 RepID=A0A4Q7ZML9_9ACTN|nr:lamin tail domain-containing protein [Krasilnikovia cinnamomea]RZU51605.1 lamin tail-like protein [Krasilnikovia cinnamomea]
MRRIAAGLAAAAVALTAAVTGASPASAAPTLRFHGAQYDSPGTDNRSNASLNAEWISLVNTGRRAVNLRGYTIRDRTGHTYRFGAVSIAANGGRLWVRTGSGTNAGRTLYWGSRAYIWNNTGDTAYLRTAAGTNVDSCSWGYRSGRTWVAC